MRKADLCAAASELPTGRERREFEQLVTDWEQETRRLGNALALMTLDVSAMSGPKWAYRFVIAVRQIVEDSSLLFYGARLASLWELPERPDHSIMTTQLPTRYVPVFTGGCIASTLSSVAVRMQGAVEREDGGQDLYRAAFIQGPEVRIHFPPTDSPCLAGYSPPYVEKPGFFLRNQRETSYP